MCDMISVTIVVQMRCHGERFMRVGYISRLVVLDKKKYETPNNIAKSIPENMRAV